MDHHRAFVVALKTRYLQQALIAYLWRANATRDYLGTGPTERHLEGKNRREKRPIFSSNASTEALLAAVMGLVSEGFSDMLRAGKRVCGLNGSHNGGPL